MSSIENKDASSLKAELIADFQLSQAKLNGKAALPIHQLRGEAMQNFDKLGFPTIRHEEWKYSNVSNLVKQTFDFHTKTDFNQADLDKIPLPHLTGNVLYFINGVYNAELSQIATPENKLKVIPFSEALAQQPELIEGYFGKYANYETDALTALNTALANDGVVVQVADNKIVEEPIILRFISDVRTANVGSQPRNLIIVGKNSQVKRSFFEVHQTKIGPYHGLSEQSSGSSESLPGSTCHAPEALASLEKKIQLGSDPQQFFPTAAACRRPPMIELLEDGVGRVNR
jgi:Fe-S cluster assembly protein SufD